MDWVISEAEHAYRLGKLVNTFAGALDPDRIPKPFGQINAVALENRRKIIAALSRAAQPLPIKSPGPSLALGGQAYPVSEAAEIVETAMRLDAEAQRQDWEQDLHDYTIHLVTAAKEVLQAMDTFELGVASINLPDFSQRVWVHRLGLAINGGRATINKEISWLQSHPTPLVTANARQDLRFTAENLIETCRHK